MTADLEPCPFCKSESIVETTSTVYLDEYRVICASEGNTCGSKSGWHDTEEEAKAAWNARPASEPLPLEPSSESSQSAGCEHVADTNVGEIVITPEMVEAAALALSAFGFKYCFRLADKALRAALAVMPTTRTEKELEG